MNTIRHKLKGKGIYSQWREIVRTMNSHKVLTTCVENDRNQIVKIRKCSEPREKVRMIYVALKYKPAPFIRKKSG